MTGEIHSILSAMAIGSALILLAQFVSNAMRLRLKLPLIGLLVALIFSVINQTALSAVQGPLVPWVDLLAFSAPFFGWVFTRHLFDRVPSDRLVLGVMAVLLFGWLLVSFFPSTGFAGLVIVHLGSVALIGDLIRIGWQGRRDDAVEQRRATRLWLPLLLAAQTLSAATLAVPGPILGFSGDVMGALLAHVLAILILLWFCGLAFLRSNTQLLGKAAVPSEADATGSSPPPATNPSDP